MSSWLLDTSVHIGVGIDPDTLPRSAGISAVSLGELRADVDLADGDAVRALLPARLEAVRRPSWRARWTPR